MPGLEFSAVVYRRQRPLYRLVTRNPEEEPPSDSKQYPFSHSALGAGSEPGIIRSADNRGMSKMSVLYFPGRRLTGFIPIY